jgi:hypothetical protein
VNEPDTPERRQRCVPFFNKGEKVLNHRARTVTIVNVDGWGLQPRLQVVHRQREVPARTKRGNGGENGWWVACRGRWVAGLSRGGL